MKLLTTLNPKSDEDEQLLKPGHEAVERHAVQRSIHLKGVLRKKICARWKAQPSRLGEIRE
jgi:hypothetical protein